MELLMEQIKEVIEKIISQSELSYDRLPDIDLYMDQVIEYLSRQSISQKENDKISPAMINNYIKDGLLPRATDKKYNRDHLAYLIMIARLKQTISVKDTGVLLKSEADGMSVAEHFDNFRSLVAEIASEYERTLPDNEEELSKVAMRLAVIGYVNKLVCELILARLNEKVSQNDAENAPVSDIGKEITDEKSEKKDKSSGKKEKK